MYHSHLNYALGILLGSLLYKTRWLLRKVTTVLATMLLLHGSMLSFLPSGYNDPVNQWVWNVHGTDWIYQGGPDSTAVKNDPFFNQWQDLDDSPAVWHITEPVDMNSVDPWLSEVGGGIY